jgi:hypothetical protein
MKISRRGRIVRLLSMSRLVSALLAFMPAPAQAGGTTLFPIAETRYSWPLRLGGAIGVNVIRPAEPGRLALTVPSILVEAGRDGIKLDTGARYGSCSFMPICSACLSASCMYLWSGDDAAYLGVEASFSALVMTIYGGAFRRFAGDREDDWMLSAGIGAGLP